MKRKMLSLLLAVVLAFSAMLVPQTVLAAEDSDTTPPAVLVETLSVSQKNVITGDTVRASVVITDASFITEAYIFYESPETQTVFFMPMFKNANTGKCIVDMPIDNYTECGNWNALYIAAVDEHGNEIIVGDSDEADIKADLSKADFTVISVFAQGEPPHDYRITIDQTLQLEVLSKKEVKWTSSDESVAGITDIKFGDEYDSLAHAYKGSCTVVPEKTGLVDILAEDIDGTVIGAARILVVKSVEFYKVYFDYQGGKVGLEYIEVPVGYAVELPSSYKAGSSIAGWSRNPYAIKGEFFAGNYFVPDNDVKLYAVWPKSQSSYSPPPIELKLNLNDGKTSPEVIEFDDSARYVLPEPQREGYTCIGWSAQKYAVIPKYTCGSNIAVSKDMELYAVWIENGSEESYDYVVQMHEQPKIEFKSFYQVKKWVSSNDSVAFPDRYSMTVDNAPVEEREFHCNIVPRKTGVTEFFALDENDCIIASFRVLVKESTELFRVDFDTTGGEALPSAQNIKYNGTVKLPTPTRDGYVCLGWSKDEKATKVDYKCSAIYTVRANTTLFAVWHKLDPDGYQVVFDYNDETGAKEELEVNYGDSVTFPTPTRDGYVCIGWSTRKDATAPGYSLSSDVKITEDKVFYAVWKSVDTIFYKVLLYPKLDDPFYDGPGVEIYELKYGEGMTLPTPKADGYTCVGWATSLNESEAAYACGEFLIPERNISLYGFWVKNSTITLGDVNDDGNINSTDALMTLQHAVSKIKLKSEALASADTNKDGAVNSTDALMILQYTVGKRTEF